MWKARRTSPLGCLTNVDQNMEETRCQATAYTRSKGVVQVQGRRGHVET
jgi:hypothetical protein